MNEHEHVGASEFSDSPYDTPSDSPDTSSDYPGGSDASGASDGASSFGAGVAAPGEGGAKSAPKKRTRKPTSRKTSTRRKTTKAKAAAEDSDGEGPLPAKGSAGEAEEGAAKPARKKRARRKTTKKPSAKASAAADDAECSEAPRASRSSAKSRAADQEAPDGDGEAPPKRKRSRTRRKPAAKRAEADSEPEGERERPRDDRDDRDYEARDREARDRDDRDREDRDRDDRDRDDRDDRDRGSKGRGRGSRRSESHEEGQDRTDDDRDRDDDAASEDGDGKKRRRRGSRGGRRRKTKDASEPSSKRKGKDKDRDKDQSRSEASFDGATVDIIPGEEDELPAAPREKAKRKRKRSRSKKDDGERLEDDEDSGKGSKKKRKRATKKKKDEAPELTAEEKAEAAEALRTDVIYINATDPEEKRVAVVGTDNRIHDLLMTSESQKTLVNDIYRGRVVNLEPAIGAAFVDFGQGRNGFLHTSDVLPMYGEDGFSLDQLLTASVDPDEWDSSAAQATVGSELDDGHAEDGDDADSRAGDDEDRDEEESGGSRTRRKKAGKKAAKKASKSGQSAKGKKGSKDSARSSSRRRARLPISELLKVGDQVVVQVTKDAIGDKGPTLTTYISIPGRYLVLMPSMARTGVSRKIPDDKERRRLKRILASLKSPTEMGVIVRTAGVGKTKTDLQRDLDYLLGVWETFGKRLKSGRGPSALYQESDVAIRTLRDLFNKTTKKVVVDDPGVLEQLDEFASKLMPEHAERIRSYGGDRPIFHDAGIEQDFEKVFARRVELASGGSVVFDQAEALVAIDVNSGRTRTDSFDFEEIALKTNLEAVPEIARQIRLRDLGGIIVCDFIDMMKSSSNRAVERALRAELSPDRARSKLGRISQFGLLELTRQRLGPGTHKKVFQACPRCRGTARIRTVESRAQAILRRLGSALTQKGFSKVEVRCHPEVVVYLKEDLWDYMRALEHRFEKELTLTAVPDQPEDSVLRYLRADGREVRPGGRRKR